MRVEADMFSGRPNPQWELSADDANDVQAALQKLPPAPTTDLSDELGFRGFVCSDDSTQTRIVARRGMVWICGPAGVRCHRDPTRGLERMLFAQARARLAPELCDLLSGELALE